MFQLNYSFYVLQQISCSKIPCEDAHRSLTPAVSLTRPLFSVAVSFHAEVTKIACPFPSSPCGTWPRKVKFNSFWPLLAFPHSSSQFLWGPVQFLDSPLFVGLPASISFSGCLICLSALHKVYSAQVSGSLEPVTSQWQMLAANDRSLRADWLRDLPSLQPTKFLGAFSES